MKSIQIWSYLDTFHAVIQYLNFVKQTYSKELKHDTATSLMGKKTNSFIQQNKIQKNKAWFDSAT